jgi:hypothetical protein
MAITAQQARQELARRELARRQQQLQQPEINEQPQQQQEGISSIPSDIADTASNAVMGLGEKAMRLPEEISAGVGDTLKNPISGAPRRAGNILSGLLEGAKGTYNLPLELNTYLAKKGVPLFKQTAPLAEKLKIGDTGLRKAVMGEDRPEDELFQDIGMLGGVMSAPESVTGKLPAVTSKGLMKRISKHKGSEIEGSSQAYNKLFSEAKKEGINYTPTGKILDKNADYIQKYTTKNENMALKDYMKEPTLENAHKAQSELGGVVRKLQKANENTGYLPPAQMKLLKIAESARKEIQYSMFRLHPELAERYAEITKNHLENVIPYTTLKSVKEFEKGKKLPKDALNELINDKEFMATLAKKYPGLKFHTTTVKDAAKYGGSLLVGALGANELKKLFSEK